jgi:hypothetical protein
MSQYGYVKATDGDITSCSRVSEWTPLSPISRRPHPPSVAFSHTSFRIPRESESLSFFKRGLMRPGSFEVDVDPSLPEDVINVTFHALYTPSALVSSSSYVCLLQNGEGNLTFGIYVRLRVLPQARQLLTVRIGHPVRAGSAGRGSCQLHYHHLYSCISAPAAPHQTSRYGPSRLFSRIGRPRWCSLVRLRRA